MEFFEAIHNRRSVRKFLPKTFPHEAVQKAIEAAQKAPNSSNMQTWEFYWVQGKDKEFKEKVNQICLNQSASRTCDQFLVVTCNPKLWKKRLPQILNWVESVKAPKLIHTYYKKLIPFTYSSGPLNLYALFKGPLIFFTGLFRPMARGPITSKDIEQVAVKSAALASENFVLAITAQGGATCMMEGFDEWRMKKLLKLPCSSKVVMTIAIGYADEEKGLWGPQFRVPFEEVVKIVN
jgi:nitroreductase